jgi:hypothetical protein
VAATIGGVRRVLAAFLLVVALLATDPTAAGAAAKPSVSARPNPVAFGELFVVGGRSWPVIEFCSRTVRLSLRSAQNAFRIGTARTRLNGRFRFEWVPRRAKVGRGDWRLVARMRCESGKDGSLVPVRASTPLHIGRANLVVGRGSTAAARWALYARRGRFGGFCVGLGTRPLDGPGAGGGGESCGGGPGSEPLTFGLFFAQGRGTFAYGMAAARVARVDVRFGAGAPRRARLLSSPRVLGFGGRFWLATFGGPCAVVSAQAFGADGASLGGVETFPPPPPGPRGEPAGARAPVPTCPSASYTAAWR